MVDILINHGDVMLDVDVVLKMRKGMTAEYLSVQNELPDCIWETYSAFANTFGGVIILGAEEASEKGTFNVIGVSNSEKLIADFWNTINDEQKISCNILYDNQVYSLTVEDKQIIVIEVPRAERKVKPIYVGKDISRGVFRRNDKGNYHCEKSVVLDMLRDVTLESVDGTVLDNLEITDLNQTTIASYRELFKMIRPKHIWNSLRDDAFLIKIGAAKKSVDKVVKPTLAGLLCFGYYDQIIDELPNFSLEYKNVLENEVVTAGDGKWSGNIFDFYFKVFNGVATNISLADAMVGAIINAVVHADYYGRKGIFVEKTMNKLVISNPGTLRISLEEAISGGVRDIRNKGIYNIFSLINVCGKVCMNLNDVYDIWNVYGFGNPKLKEFIEPDCVQITMPLRKSH